MKKNYVFIIMLFLLQSAVFGQTKVVKGIIKDSKTNETIPGVTVLVEGTTNATVTDVTGMFTITVEGEGKKLLFSSVGYVTQAVAADKDMITVSLVMNTTMLKETVVTALGVSKEKKSLGYSVSEVSGDDVRKSGETNVIEGLAAKAPGVEVVGSGGTPGASTKITLRGPTSFSGSNQPIVVIDGVIMDNSTNTPTAGDAPFNVNLAGINESNRGIDINPDDIESVSILKGPAAAALYGSQAGNGAIVYTTKRGKAGKNFGVSFSTAVAIDKVSQLPALQTTYAQGKLTASGPVYSTSTPNSWGPAISTLPGKAAHDLYKDFFKTGYTYTNNASIFGGNENSSIRLSLGNTSQTGIVPNTKLSRTSIRLTADSKISDKISTGGTVDYINTGGNRTQNGSNLAGTMLTLTRTPAEFDITNYQNADGTQRQYYGVYDNPLYSAYKNTYTDQTNRMIGNVFLNYKPLEFLDVTWKVGTDLYHTATQQVYAISSMGDDNTTGMGQINKSSLMSRTINSDLLLKFSKQVSKDFGLDAMLGYNFHYIESQFQFTRGRGLSIPEYYNLNNASELYSSNSDYYQKSNALFLDATVNYKRWLYLNLTGRNEWNSAFGKNGKSFFYPKADLSWVFTETFKLPKWLSFGKVRAAYANGGTGPVSYSDRTYYYVPIYTDGYTNGNTLPYLGQSGYAISPSLGNPDIKPERVIDQEAGINLSFLNNRVTFDFTYYSQKSKDLLMYQPVAASSGYTARYVNAGSMTNKGVELAIGGDPIKTKNFDWNITLGWSQNKNNVTALTNGVTKFQPEIGFGGLNNFAIVGQPYGVFYGSTWKRNGNGDLLLDADGYPQLSSEASVVGNPYPKWLMNINNTFTYKNLTFSFLWDIRHGGDIWNGTEQSLNTKGKSAASADRNQTYDVAGVYDAGTPSAGQAHTTKLSAYDYFTYYKGQNGADESAVQDGSWIRLRSVGISYRLDLTKGGEKKMLFKYVELGVSARNLYLKTKYTGVDPETSLTGAGSNIKGFDYFNNPGTKSYFFNLKFGI
ncbi:MAG: SusC/RagA family TonB-linked outer membrane protein [Bacteroidota bacterium]